MEKSIIAKTFFVTGVIILFGSCNSKESPTNPDKIEVRYIEQICCGNMLSTNNFNVSSSCELYKDSLLRAVNLDEFSIAENYQFGDILTIEFELTENCEASCEITCDRMNGVPIKLLSVE